MAETFTALGFSARFTPLFFSSHSFPQLEVTQGCLVKIDTAENLTFSLSLTHLLIITVEKFHQIELFATECFLIKTTKCKEIHIKVTIIFFNQ